MGMYPLRLAAFVILFPPALVFSQSAPIPQDSIPMLRPSSLSFAAPDFSQVRIDQFRPAMDGGMNEQLKEVVQIANQADAPTFDNTIVAMERTGQSLRRVAAIFFHLAGADTTPEIQAIEADVAPLLAAHSDNIYLNAPLFKRVDQLWNDRETLGLGEEASQLLKETHEKFVRAGARLAVDDQAKVRRLNERLSSLETEFQTNLLAITKERSVIIDNQDDLAGLTAAEIQASQTAAKSRGMGNKFLLPITNTTRQPALASLKNREIRKRLWEASAYRGQGQNGGIDNRGLVLEIAKLRAERASLLGYASHAAFQLENQMAGTPDAAIDMLKPLAVSVLEKAMIESEAIASVMAKDGIDGPVQPWDWEYYAEKVRSEKFAVDESLVKPYFELERVLRDGVFFTMNQLYGISFRERKDLPVYHPTVRVFDVIDKDGKAFGLFYADYYERESKRGGAWMDALVSQSSLLDQSPVIVNVMNIPRPAEGQPTLISLDNVTTMFHEMGHAVHGLFSNVTYPSLSGTSVPRDFVEFPSTFHEDWAIDPKVLGNFAKHYQTGEVIPSDLLKKSIAASKFNQGFDTLEYLKSALLDLSWHSMSSAEATKLAAAGPDATTTFEQETFKELGIDIASVPPRYKTPFFAHIWSGGYSAGYYAYLWSEVLAADAFAFMRDHGGLTSTNGQSFRDKILSRGGALEVMDQYIDFRGERPQIDGLLERRGLK